MIFSTFSLPIVLEEKDNIIPELNNEIISLRGSAKCYKITFKGDFNSLNGRFRTFKLDFGNHLEKNGMPVRAIFYATSYQNSFRVDQGKFHYGKPHIIEVLMNHHAIMNFKAKKTQYLKTKHVGCNEKTQDEVLEEQFASDIVEKCPNPCSPFLLPYESVPVCTDSGFNYQCAVDVYNHVVSKSNYSGWPCSVLEYEGRVLDNQMIPGAPRIHVWDTYDRDDVDIILPWNFFHAINPGNTSVMLSYKFDFPETMTVEVESYVVTIVDLIGIVGGTLYVLR